jgi:rhodanese-related sulfurtransferase
VDTPQVPQISRGELVARLHDPSLTIVNVLPREAWLAEHIPGSLSLPFAEIPQRAAAVLPDRNADIVVYCASPTCHLGEQSVGVLQGLGYARVRDYDGGLAEWTAAGLVAEKGDSSQLLTIATSPVRPAAGTNTSRRAGAMAWISQWSIGGLLGTWLTINLACGILYWMISFVPGHGLREPLQPMGHGGAALLEAIYFSFVTGLSIGFGDIVPVGAVRVMAVIQGGACLLVFGAIISKLVSGRQEELTEEIHHIAFEDRLGRVRTNLHLVVSEIQEISELVGDGRTTPSRVQTRIESATAIFTGELRTIHDLLYRPQTAPDEDVLESILAHLEGGLREFGHLLECMSGEARNAPALSTNVRVLAGLANEICGSCVPRAYAPQLKVWMDRIQGHAREMTRVAA